MRRKGVPSAEGRPRLAAALRAAIRAHGPLTFAAYMDAVLYHPTLGYYSALRAPPGAHGDFYTSPEAHPAFGALLMRQAREVWERLGRPATFTVEEWGGGSGSLAADFLTAADAEAPEFAATLHYRLVERAGAPRRWQARRLRPWAARVKWAAPPDQASGIGDQPSAEPREQSPSRAQPLVLGPKHTFEGIVLANELLDAFAVHRVVWRGGVLHERYVALADGAFVEVDGPPSTPALAAYFARLGHRPPDDCLAEVNLGALAWLRGVAARLARGAALIVDYGHPAEVLYSARYPRGSLRAYYQHALAENPYARVGHQDLTSQVDLTSLLLEARAAGLLPLGLARQADFLRRLGLEAWADAVRAADWPVAETRTALTAIGALGSPNGLGRLWVVGLGRGVGEAPLHGLNEGAASLDLPPPPGLLAARLGWDRQPAGPPRQR